MEQEHSVVPRPGIGLALRVFAPFAAGYFLSYLYRTVNAVIAPDLVRDFRVDPAELGFLTSVYFLTFAATQLPLGMLLDRYGPRRVNAGLLVVAAAGAAVFALAGNLATLTAGRALIGVGVSGALMAALKAFTVWFPAERLATVNGWLMAVGGLGAVMASAPVGAMLAVTDWRGVFALLAALTLAAAVVLVLVVPRTDAARSAPGAWGGLVRGVLQVYSDGMFWRVGLACLTVQAGFLAVQGLWIAPWLSDVAGFPRPLVAQNLFWMAVATTAGFAFFGDAADRFGPLGLDALALLRLAAIASILALAGLAAGLTAVALPLCLVYGFASTGIALSYAILSRRFPTTLSGRVNTAINLLVFVGAFVLQWALGFVIGAWSPVDGHYPETAYRVAFGGMVAVQVIAVAPVLLHRGRA